jgi:CheY-like chemotaxis protein/HPt (histidine-containing phosphotransfer) domain-containing protein
VKEVDLTDENSSHSPPLGMVLLAEDDPAAQQDIEGLLQRLGFSVQVVTNGTLAVQTAVEDSGRYALILMDCEMPDLDGFDAAKMIRENEGLSAVRIPIVGLVETGSRGSYEDCFASGMDDCIPKPVPVDELKQVMQKWARPILMNRSYEGSVESTELEDSPLDYAVLDGIRELQMEDEPDVLVDLIGMYLENSTALLGRVRIAMTERNYSDLRKSVHSLKGTSSTLGAHRLSNYCNEVLRLVDQNTSFDFLDVWMPRLEVEHARVCQALQAEQKK